MNPVFAIAAGGALGAAGRHFINTGLTRLLGDAFPWGIFAVNILGSFLMGCLAAWFAHKGQGPAELKAFLGVGVLGGFTTFSAFSLDAALLIERGQLGLSALYTGGSVLLAIGGLFAGMALVRAVAA